MNSSKLDSDQKETCRLWCSDLTYKTLNKEDVRHGLMNLAEYLHTHFNRKVFVLVDEYDSIIVSAMFDVSKRELKSVVNLVIGEITKLCKSNTNVEYAEYGLITGISYVAGGGFSNMNNVQVYKFLDNHQFVSFYGFLK